MIFTLPFNLKTHQCSNINTHFIINTVQRSMILITKTTCGRRKYNKILDYFSILYIILKSCTYTLLFITIITLNDVGLYTFQLFRELVRIELTLSLQ